MTTTMPASKRSTLAECVRAANPSILLASLVSITGDTSKIDKYAPNFEHNIVAGEIEATLPDSLRSELNSWAIEVLSSGTSLAVQDLDDETFLRLAESLVGWELDPQDLGVYREHSGFERFSQSVPATASPPNDFALLIVGAGMAGITAAVRAEQMGVNYVLLEKQPEIGGVWWQNRYPGVAVDTPAETYSLSFELNPDWEKGWPSGAEFQSYLEKIVEKYSVREQIQFGADVSRMEWDNHAKHWTVTFAENGQEKTLTANAVITGAGYLVGPSYPDVPGIKTFAGESFHSSEWDYSVDLAGKRVAVIGTGCSSAQIVHSIADEVGELTVFQRQPHWVMPLPTHNAVPEQKRWLKREVPGFVNWSRLHAFLPDGDANFHAVRFDEGWASSNDLSISERNDMFRQMGVGHLDAKFADHPELRRKLQPNYAPWGKRIIFDPGHYYDAFKLPTTTLVTDGISEITPEGIVDGSGELHEFDIIVYATGYVFNYLHQWEIKGSEGVTLQEVWGDSPLAYNGNMVPGFPNLFITSGPHASPGHGLGHGFMVESVIHYAFQCLQAQFNEGAAAVDVTDDALERWRQEMRQGLTDSIWVKEKKATTYYRNAEGDVILPSPLLLNEFWRRLRAPDLKDLQLVSR